MRWEDQVGANVRRLRKAAGLSQEALADRAGMSMRYLAGLERGEENPTVTYLVKLANALDVSPAAFFEQA
ncbi:MULTISPECIES: helix-turn-helix domain-containing protein [unclassified Brevundimonas]|uniref:helix-turn-helix domain-containing protein n=1 Tax=unclassified Brevundimonas TaxID=2622653 RepID=UPI0025BC9C8B|nr:MULTISPECIES: helix-turn-helix transcriptional regulator [unclassified Brevundimonas]